MRLWGALAGGCLGIIGLLHQPRPASGFTQGAQGLGIIAPLGHEWITRLSAVELLDGSVLGDKDPRRKLGVLAGNTHLDTADEKNEVARIRKTPSGDTRFTAKYKLVYDAIIGERWVDIGGIAFPQAKFSDAYNCLDLVTQEPPEVQYDHFMRRHDDTGGDGGVRAADKSRKQFQRYFVEAAMAKQGSLTVWDGGATSTRETVDRNYFLFGRAVHLFEDSFSDDHTVRIASDGYHKVRQVKSYLCAMGSEQHAHKLPLPDDARLLDPVQAKKVLLDFYATGDVIWNTTAPGHYAVTDLKPLALAATEGTKDLWAAFIRTMATPLATRREVAEKEAAAVANTWLSFDEAEMKGWYKDPAHRGGPNTTYVAMDTAEETGWGTTQAACMKRDWNSKTQTEKLNEFAEGRRICLWNMVPSNTTTEDERDGSLQLSFLWKRRNGDTFETPPDSFNIGDAVAGVSRVTLVNRSTRAPLRRDGDSLYASANIKADQTTLEVLVSNDLRTPGVGSSMLAAGSTTRYIGIKENIDRTAQLYEPTKPRRFHFIRRKDGFYNIRLVDESHQGRDWSLLHLRDGRPSFGSVDNPEPFLEKAEAQWEVRGLPEAPLGDVDYRLVAPSGAVVTLDAGTKRLITAAPAPSENSSSQRFRLGSTDDGYSYHIRPQLRSGLELKSNGTSDKSIEASSASADTYGFILELQPNGKYRIRNREDRRYWREGHNQIRADVTMDCVAEGTAAGDHENPIISGGPAPPKRPSISPRDCVRMTEFKLELSW